MLKRLSRAFAKQPVAPKSEIEPVRLPQLHQFGSVQLWLEAWVGHRIAYTPGRSVAVSPEQIALPLVGSLGVDSAIGADGQVWIHLYELGEDAFESGWRRADANERNSILISSQHRLYPELIVLLPIRPANAIDCSDCQGTGHKFHSAMMWCPDCGTLGWVVPEAAGSEIG